MVCWPWYPRPPKNTWPNKHFGIPLTKNNFDCIGVAALWVAIENFKFTRIGNRSFWGSGRPRVQQKPLQKAGREAHPRPLPPTLLPDLHHALDAKRTRTLLIFYTLLEADLSGPCWVTLCCEIWSACGLVHVNLSALLRKCSHKGIQTHHGMALEFVQPG